MKCIVCGKVHDGNECPVCKFPKIHFPGDPQEGLRTMKPAIDSYRDSFLERVSVGVITYRWKDEGGTIVLDREERVAIGTGKKLREAAVWLEESFARIPEAKELAVKVSVQVDGQEEVHTVKVPTRMEAELQQLGAEIDEELNLSLLLRNDSGSTRSEKEPLFR